MKTKINKVEKHFLIFILSMFCYLVVTFFALIFWIYIKTGSLTEVFKILLK